MTQRQKKLVLGGACTMIAVAAAAVLVIGLLFPPGMRLLRMEVYQEGQLILRTTFDAPDRERPDELWDHTGSEPFAGEEATPIATLGDDPLRAELTGPIEIRIVHVDRVLTSAILADLELVRQANGSGSWYLPTAEVARARQAADR